MVRAVTPTTSLDTPGLEPYRTLKRSQSLRDQGRFVAEGTLVVERLLRSPLAIISLLLTKDQFERFQRTMEDRPGKTEVFIAERALLETIVGFRFHQGIMAVATVPPGLPMEDALLEAPRPRIFAAVDGLSSAENTGVLVRNCAAGGVQALLVGETSADPYLRRAVRNSMGTLFKLPIIYCNKLTDALRHLRQEFGFRLFAAHPRPDSAPLQSADFHGDICIVFGSEGEGVSEEVVRECDRSITIPMAAGIDSFNVACASAVVLYEAMRQRTTPP